MLKTDNGNVMGMIVSKLFGFQYFSYFKKKIKTF